MKATDEELAVIANRIKWTRTKAGLTQMELADCVDTTPTSVHLWEAGKATPSVVALRGLARALNCSTDYLLGLTDTPNGNERGDERAAVLNHIRCGLHYAAPAVRTAMELLMDSLAQGNHLPFDER